MSHDEDDKGWCAKHRTRIWISDGCEQCEAELEAVLIATREYIAEDEIAVDAGGGRRSLSKRKTQ